MRLLWAVASHASVDTHVVCVVVPGACVLFLRLDLGVEQPITWPHCVSLGVEQPVTWPHCVSLGGGLAACFRSQFVHQLLPALCWFVSRVAGSRGAAGAGVRG